MNSQVDANKVIEKLRETINNLHYQNTLQSIKIQELTDQLNKASATKEVKNKDVNKIAE